MSLFECISVAVVVAGAIFKFGQWYGGKDGADARQSTAYVSRELCAALHDAQDERDAEFSRRLQSIEDKLDRIIAG